MAWSGGVQRFLTMSCSHWKAAIVPSSAQLMVTFPWLSSTIGLPPKVQIQGQKPTRAYSVLETSMPIGQASEGSLARRVAIWIFSSSIVVGGFVGSRPAWVIKSLLYQKPWGELLTGTA